MPTILLPDNQPQGFNIWQFLPAWMSQKFNKRGYESAVTSHIDNLSVKAKNPSSSFMFVYKCPDCGWEIKSPETFTDKKPCMNCNGFVELQNSGGDKAEAIPAPFEDNEPKQSKQ